MCLCIILTIISRERERRYVCVICNYVLAKGLSYLKKNCFIIFADCHGVSIPTIADFKLPLV